MKLWNKYTQAFTFIGAGFAAGTWLEKISCSYDKIQIQQEYNEKINQRDLNEINSCKIEIQNKKKELQELVHSLKQVNAK